MSNINRIKAITSIASRPVLGPGEPSLATIDFYGADVFNAAAMRQYLPKAIAEKLLSTINNGTPLDPAISVDVAHAMKEWAMARGATHFTHWFQPLTGGTAEKHDSFLESTGQATAIMEFSGKNLIMSEPDASSFPSGGLRCTFEARGYTAWDPTSPAFIKRHNNGATLCIPTAFCSYTGEALDKKTPLLRSIQALTKSVERFMKCFGKEKEHTSITLGAEQEYFLIDKNFYLHRPDLVQTGRTLFGAPPPKHQQLEDHYFGSIKPRILNFMNEVEKELWKLGIPAKTRHNEVAPAQFELAPIFEELNLAVDHNMLVMEVLRQVADRNGLVCLLHEKPFTGVNGSGKHNNWSVTYGKLNLLDPGHEPLQNAIFLTTLLTVIRAVDLHSDILRSATASAGNDHRLGANEAPPAIISIFLGSNLSEVIEHLEGVNATGPSKPGHMKIGVDTLPALPRDATDRNRTSPFAFTGNKFEFRAPGSSQSCAGINMILNTLVAESMDYVSSKMEKFAPEKFNEQLQKLLKDLIKKHKKVIFNGDNYSSSWHEEAAKRNLPNLHNTVAALQPLKDKANQELFERYGVLSCTEMESRYEVFMEEYQRKIHIEGGIALEIARSIIMPVIAEEFNRINAALNTAMANNVKYGIDGLSKLAEKLGTGLDQVSIKCDELEAALNGDCENVIKIMNSLRKEVDSLEHVVDDTRWPLPKYREMLFIY